MRIRLTIQPPEMASLPWELLCSRATGDFLATSTRTLLARYVEVQMPLRDLRVSPPIKLLGIIPRGSGLDVGAEKTVLQEALGELGGAVGSAPPSTGRGASGAVRLTWLEGTVTTTRISDALLEDDYHIVHYIGHGVFEGDQGHLVINDETGQEHPINERQFARLFLNHPSVRLIVLNACQGAAVSATRPFVGIAPQLVRRGIPAVIAMQYPVYEDVALRFAREFYRCLCMGAAAGQVDAAVSYARNQLCIHFPNERAVATPVLFLRAPDGIIFDLS